MDDPWKRLKRRHRATCSTGFKWLTDNLKLLSKHEWWSNTESGRLKPYDCYDHVLRDINMVR